MVKYKYKSYENWRERDKVYGEMPDAILRISFHPFVQTFNYVRIKG